MKKLNELFKVESDIKIESIHSDSRYVRKDSIFFCIEGLVTDGHKYVDDAIFQGGPPGPRQLPAWRCRPGPD